MHAVLLGHAVSLAQLTMSIAFVAGRGGHRRVTSDRTEYRPLSRRDDRDVDTFLHWFYRERYWFYTFLCCLHRRRPWLYRCSLFTQGLPRQHSTMFWKHIGASLSFRRGPETPPLEIVCCAPMPACPHCHMLALMRTISRITRKRAKLVKLV